MAATDGAEVKRSGDSSSAGGDRTPLPEMRFGNGAGASLPEQLGRYRIKRKLGGGSMGAVFLVENTDLQREEALKVPHFESGDDSLVRERFLREARLAARLDHPNLCPIYDFGVIDGVYFLTMRYLPGKPLSAYTRQAHSPRQAIEIVDKLAQALEHAHARGVIHRDLKPSNVMMCAEAGPMVFDFGLAKQTQQTDEKLTQTGMMMGTPAYMPPEQVRGELHRIGPASDVYSLGVILFELLTGRLPFQGAMAEVFAKILFSDAPLPSQLRSEVGPVLDAICSKAMARAPKKRYPSMKAFADALSDVRRTIAPAVSASAPAATRDAGDSSLPTVHHTPAPDPEREKASKPPSIREDLSGLEASLRPERAKARPADKPTLKEPSRPCPGPPPSRPENRGRLGLMLILFLPIVGVGTVLFPFAGRLLDPDRNLSRNDKQGRPGLERGKGKEKGKQPEDPPNGAAVVKDWGKEMTNSIGMKLVRIPAGKFTMGSPRGEADRSEEEEQHEVEITRAFWLGMHEVTQRQFKRVMGYNPSYFSTDGKGKPGAEYRFGKPAGGKEKVAGKDTSGFPVENVSWEEATEFCQRLTELTTEILHGRKYRLPSEAEWEYSCRGGARSYQVFHFGNSLSSSQANFNSNFPYGGAAKGDPLDRTCKVGSYEKNAFGLYDMHGNVYEWCADRYASDSYSKSRRADPEGPMAGSNQVFRGGSWSTHGLFCRSAFRNWYAPARRDFNLGFRIALVPSGK